MQIILIACNLNTKIYFFFLMIRVPNEDGGDLFSAICGYLEKIKLLLNKFVGLAANNATVMMGNILKVQTRFRAINPQMFVLGRVCHLFKRCSSFAAKKLPKTL